ncbi:Olfactory receptor-like protein OLF4 [Fukomys damarensis]|uniref:Olfactory receptor-like protein OLF4 n=1 Tax=Fukomys damarensis TaxID=885580 RepID=A0A091D967_FUKDA|nr:Olfactory receptor-like protein OLF4 [Fukomys damarensis]
MELMTQGDTYISSFNATSQPIRASSSERVNRAARVTLTPTDCDLLATLEFLVMTFRQDPQLVHIHIKGQSFTLTNHPGWKLHFLAETFFSEAHLGLDDFLLAVMAYDRFGAICHPLHYTIIMNPQLCMWIVLVSCVISALHALV